MKGKRYSHEKIIGIPKAHEAGAKVADLGREHGISEQSFYRWNAKCGGMEVGDAKRIKEFETENARLKHILAEAELNKAVLKDVLSNKW
jgi:putative transposase